MPCFAHTPEHDPRDEFDVRLERGPQRRHLPHFVPQATAGDQCRLDHLGEAGAKLCLRERRERAWVGDHGGGLVKGADVVLPLGKVDPRLAAVGRVDLGHDGRGDVHDGHTALIARGAEAGEIAGDAAAERDDRVRALHARRRKGAQDPFCLGHRLAALAGRDRDRGA
jgi:hypothetical protein